MNPEVETDLGRITVRIWPNGQKKVEISLTREEAKELRRKLAASLKR